MHSESKRLAYYGEFRSGKTLVAGSKVVELLFGYPGTFWAIIRNRHQDLWDSTIPQFKSIWNWDLWGGSFNKTQKRLEMPNGSVVRFYALDRPEDAAKLKNVDLGGYWIEQAEEIPEAIFNMAEGRLSQKDAPHVGIITGNPEGKQWDYYKFFSQALDVVTDDYLPLCPGDDQLPSRKLTRGIFRGESEDYLGFLPPPFLNEANIPQHYYYGLIKNNSQEWSDKYVWGMFSGHAGLLHKDFSRDRHVLSYEDYVTPPEQWVRVDGMDYGVSNPTCWLFVAYARDTDTIYFMDEYYVAGENVFYHGPKVQSYYAIYDRPSLTIGCPRAFQTERDGKTPADEYRQKFDINLSPHPVGLEARVEICNRRFQQGKIKIFDRCHNLIKQLEGAGWKNVKTFENHALEAFQRVVAKVDTFSSFGQFRQMMEAQPKRGMVTAGLMNEAF